MPQMLRKQVPLIIEGKLYPGYRPAAKILKIPASTINTRVMSRKPQWREWREQRMKPKVAVKHYGVQPVRIFGVIYPSIKKACDELEIPRTTLTDRIKARTEGYALVNPRKRRKVLRRTGVLVVYNGVTYPSCAAAGRACGCVKQTICRAASDPLRKDCYYFDPATQLRIKPPARRR